MTDKEQINKCQCTCDECGAECEPFWKKENKEQVICKYMFQDEEKFDGKPYCLCFNELCEDLPPCNDNCQIYEDYKQLQRKTQECEELKEKLSAANLEIENLKKELDKAYEWEQTNRATGICETCTEKANLTLDIYRNGINKIEKFINEIKENC